MVPSTEVAVPSEPEAKHTGSPDTLVLEPRTPEISTTQPVSRPVPSPRPSTIRTPEEGSFRASLLEYNRMTSSSRPLDILISLLMNVAILSAPILVGLYFTDTINLKQLESTFLVAPPPPPPPPPAPATVVVRPSAPRKVFENAGKLIAPTSIPKNIALIKEAPLPPDMEGAGVPGGVPVVYPVDRWAELLAE